MSGILIETIQHTKINFGTLVSLGDLSAAEIFAHRNGTLERSSGLNGFLFLVAKCRQLLHYLQETRLEL